MPFPLPLSIAIYFVIWFVVLFAVLPFGISSQREAGDVARGTDPGAPASPGLLAKAFWTTAISAAVFIALSIFVQHVRL